MTIDRLDTLFDRWSDGSLGQDDTRELNALLRSSADARKKFQESAQFHGLLHAATNAIAMESAASPWMPIRGGASNTHAASYFLGLYGLIIGIAIGLVGITTVWALASPNWVAVSRPIGALNNADFELDSDSICQGFPEQLGRWGGDDLLVTARDPEELASGHQALQFVTALPDALNPSARAIACDVFQLVDLRELQVDRRKGEDLVIELTASFSDQRTQNTQPSVTFFCQLYLFRGQASQMHLHWPDAICDAVSSGSAQITTLGDPKWQDLTARCLVPDQADFAVVHLAARPNMRGSFPPGLLVDNVRLDAKILPLLPVRLR